MKRELCHYTGLNKGTVSLGNSIMICPIIQERVKAHGSTCDLDCSEFQKAANHTAHEFQQKSRRR
jgi:hypothetical protein